MSAQLLDGKAAAAEIRRELEPRIAKLRAAGVVPGLGVILVGDNPASVTYVSAKERACAEMGLYSQQIRLPATASEREILGAVDSFNSDPRIHGILVQRPLPNTAMEARVLERVAPTKDVDGFHPLNIGRAALGQPAFLPCTPHGILRLLRRNGIPVSGADVVIVGRSAIVGAPLARLLMRKGEDATVTVCHTATRDLAAHTRRADIVVVAAGKPRTVSGDMIRPGAVVVDVGVNRVPDPDSPRGYRLVGDVAFDEVAQKASWITPVPGGVGPMTIAMLLWNTVWAAEGGPYGNS